MNGMAQTRAQFLCKHNSTGPVLRDVYYDTACKCDTPDAASPLYLQYVLQHCLSGEGGAMLDITQQQLTVSLLPPHDTQ